MSQLNQLPDDKGLRRRQVRLKKAEVLKKKKNLYMFEDVIKQNKFCCLLIVC
jgi:hypothetical protein